MYNDNDTLSGYRGMENCQSAYMLIYERKKKFPMKTVIPENLAQNVIQDIEKCNNNNTFCFYVS